ncbi:Protein of unknown function [Candidatus Hamiltonella defensa (Bemisia tabaci)]|nr:Protein of unknown function [Candidatus Hamiltonella defensa (Bemisia tabaci)]
MILSCVKRCILSPRHEAQSVFRILAAEHRQGACDQCGTMTENLLMSFV